MITTAIVFLALLADRGISSEQGITTVVLQAYFAETQGGMGVAFPEKRHPIRLADKTIAPTPAQLEVRVYSPANHDAAAKYARIAKGLTRELLSRSEHPVAVRVGVPYFAARKTHRSACGPERDGPYVDAVAVSRPGVSGRGDEALLYLEHEGGARVYFVSRTHEGWTVGWYVEVWACG